MRRTVLVLFLTVFGVQNVASQQSERAIDLRELQLRVTGAETRAELSVRSGSVQFKVTPEKGFKLVVATLTGTLPAPGRVSFAPATFSARYEGTRPTSQRYVEFAPARNVAQEDESWAATITATYTRVVPVTIKVAFSLPETVTQFTVLYGSAAGGDTTIK
jgi:hypothetical protein